MFVSVHVIVSVLPDMVVSHESITLPEFEMFSPLMVSPLRVDQLISVVPESVCVSPVVSVVPESVCVTIVGVVLGAPKILAIRLLDSSGIIVLKTNPATISNMTNAAAIATTLFFEELCILVCSGVTGAGNVTEAVAGTTGVWLGALFQPRSLVSESRSRVISLFCWVISVGVVS